MFRVKDQNSINFLNKAIDEVKTTKDKKIEKYFDSKIIEEQKSKKLNSYDNGLKTEKSIMSARSGNINDFGGSSLPVKNKNNNSIWGETAIEAEIEEKHRKITEKDFKINVASLKPVEKKIDNTNENCDVYISQNKTSIVSKPDIKHNYQTLKGNMSIFDTIDFEKLAEKTDGEQLSEKIQERNSQKDESWKTDGRTISSKQLFNNFFNNMKK